MDVKCLYSLSGPKPKTLRGRAEEGSLFLAGHLQSFLPAASAAPPLSQQLSGMLGLAGSGQVGAYKEGGAF